MTGEKILVVDDEEHIRKLVSTFLERRGYQVRLAADGAEGFTAMMDDLADLVILDVNMPVMDGIELTRKLRESRRTATIPIIMLSAQKNVDVVLEGYQQGADEYVAKPVEMSILANKIERLLQRANPAGNIQTQDHEGHLIAFAHAKGGSGATTLAVNSALVLAAEQEHQVALLDLDLEFGNTAIMLDLQPRTTMAEFAGINVDDLEDALFWQIAASHGSGVKLVAPGVPEEAELVTVTTMQQIVGRIRRKMDYVLIDMAASFSERNLAVIDVADLICVVTSQHVPALKVTKDYLAVLQQLDIPVARTLLVLSRISASGPGTDQIAGFLGRDVDVEIPYSPLLDDAANTGRPIVETHPHVPVSQEIRALATRIPRLAPARGDVREALRATA
jgi:pilus assembly protein CpaE